MKTRDLTDLFLLAALWGGSFLFMRFAAPAFGAVALIWLRVAIASLCLLPLLAMRGQFGVLRAHAAQIAVMGVFNSAFPFVLIAWATLSITAGLASILNATVPIFAALIGALWLGERLGASRLLGLAVGFVGVLLLAADKADFKPGGSGWAVVAMLVATFSYGFAANLTKRQLAGVPALVNAAGSQFISAIVLLPFAVWLWPAQTPGLMPWVAVIALGVGCTALAYLLFFRLIAHVGASRAVTVTFLIPLFGVLWGCAFLGEKLSAAMLGAGAVVVLGTALATGVLKLPGR
ncbi:DMT family transporter [Niveibacterium umoris]|uniref:Drug/metabolite transporter (DMT)-like permease n=1 Tax=Niveibacterium umoris TaxID=1193620 RepID=A0A840BEQ5_9RHOO|nr:DMT family transporter [Niveibacterium umoris]MBB4012011.1 drug/metabolite transporter (DMT)-like permease [Niveibacterium umoris]